MAYVAAPRSRYSQPIASKQIKEMASTGRRLLPALFVCALFCIAGLSFLKGSTISERLRRSALHLRSTSGGGGGSRSERLTLQQQSDEPLRLLLASHGRLLWYTPSTDASQVLHEGQGVHYGVFPGERDATGRLLTLFNVLRPHNWHPTTSEEWLLELQAGSGKEVRRVKIQSRFTHDAVRSGNDIYLANTGNGAVLQLAYPSLKLVREMKLFTLKQHINTLAPLQPGQLWAVLHNLGESAAVRIDTAASTPVVTKTISEVGDKAHGLVDWRGKFVMLDSDNAALVLVDPGAEHGQAAVVWEAPDTHLFLKGLAVVDDVAYFGVSLWSEREARADPHRDSELAAVDLIEQKLLWRRKVPTHGLLNVVAAPQLGDASTYRAMSLAGKAAADATSGSSRTAGGTSGADKAAAAIRSLVTAAVTAGTGSGTGSGAAAGRLDVNDPLVAAAHRQMLDAGYPPLVGGHWPGSGLPFMDLVAKNSNNVSRTGVAMPLGRMDIAALQAKVRAMPELMWKKDEQKVSNAVIGGRQDNMDKFKPGVETIILVFSDQSTDHVYRFPYYEYFKDEIEPIVEALVGREGMSNVVRMQFARMNPGTSIKLHMDMGGYAKKGHRLHIPILASSNVSFQVCPALTNRHADDEHVQDSQCVRVPMEEGLVFELNNRIVHRVRNQTPVPRVQFVVDVAESTRRPVQLPKGIECQYERAVIKCPGFT